MDLACGWFCKDCQEDLEPLQIAEDVAATNDTATRLKNDHPQRRLRGAPTARELRDPVLQITFIVGILQVRLDAQQEQLQSMGALVETLSAGRPVNMFFAKNVKWCVDLCVRVASDMCVVVLVHS